MKNQNQLYNKIKTDILTLVKIGKNTTKTQRQLRQLEMLTNEILSQNISNVENELNHMFDLYGGKRLEAIVIKHNEEIIQYNNIESFKKHWVKQFENFYAINSEYDGGFIVLTIKEKTMLGAAKK